MKNKIYVFVIVLLAVSGAWWFFYASRTGYKEIRNVLLISIDTCRADHLSCYGYPRQTTPNIDAIAKDAFLFENAASPIPITLPAHSSMLTGTIPPHHGVHSNEHYILPESNITMAEVLKENGFTTGAIISAFVLDAKFGMNQGFDSYNDRFEEENTASLISERKAGETSQKAVEWLEKHKDEKFFFFLHYFDPHANYEPPEPFTAQYQGGPSDLYAGEIAYTDHCIGQVIQKLKDLKIYDSTLIIITADHGEMLGEHGELTHAYFIYQSAIKVPLIIRLPGQHREKRIRDIAGLVDIAPTVYSQTGIKVTHEMQGKDLSGYFENDDLSAPDRYIYCESLDATRYLGNSLLGVVSADWKYIQTTRPELYNLTEDPAELSNLVLTEPNRARIMRDHLREILQQVSMENSGGNSKINAETIRRLESLGYVASVGIVEDFNFDQSKDDPKDLIDFSNSCARLIALLAAKRDDQARSLCKELIAQRPNYFPPYYRLATIALREKDYTAAVPYLYQTIKLDPSHYKAHLILGTALMALDKEAEALESFEKAIHLSTPGDSEVHNVIGAAMREQGKYAQALKYFETAIRLSPGDPEILYNMATTLKNLGKDNQAQTLESLANALHQQPENPDLLNRTALALMSFGKYEEAIKCFEKLLSQQPDNAPVLNNLAWAKAVYPNTAFHDPNEAVQLAKRACELSEFKEPEILDTLSVAYAAADRFTEAAESAEKAIELYTSSGRPDLAENIRKHLELYKAQKPYYEEFPQNF